MASSIIRGKYVVTRVIDDYSSEILVDGAVLQQDGVIVATGKYDDLKARHPSAEVIGSGNQVVLPGLINDHYHCGLTPFQMGTPDLSHETWAAARWSARDVDVYLDSLYGAIQMIESGITTVMHMQGTWYMPPGLTHSEVAEKTLKAYQDAGMRVVFAYIVGDRNLFVAEENERFLATLPSGLARRLRPLATQAHPNDKTPSTEAHFSFFSDLYHRFGRNQSGQRITHFVSPANVQWCSDRLLQSAKELAGRFNTGIHIHLQETIYQKMYGLRTFGTTPLAHLHELGFLGPEVTCGHGVWFTEADIDLLAETGTMVCHCPSSTLRTASGIAPINRLLQKSITVAIGVDEAGINDDKDIFQEMRLAHKLHRIPGVDSPSPTSHQVLRMATINGAKATLLEEQVGSLEPGKRADIILVNLDHIIEPYLHPATNIVDALIYRGRSLDVDTVLVDGEVIMRDRQLVRVDKSRAWAELKEQLSHPLKPHELEREEISRQLMPYVQQFYRQWPLQDAKPFYVYNASD